MAKKELLNEENYQKTKRKIGIIALIILCVGITIGGLLIFTGVRKQAEINSKYSESTKVAISQKIEEEKEKLIAEKTKIEEKIKPTTEEIKKLEREKFNGFDDAYYERKDRIEELEESIATDKNNLSVIDDALDDSFNLCNTYKVKNNTYTSNYCSLKNQLEDLNEFNKSFDSHDSIPFYMFGAIIIIASCMIAGSIYMISKRREMLAFSMQQVMPLAQEGVEKMAPTIGDAGATIADKLAPSIGNIAKHISKGINEGKENSNNNKKTSSKK